MDRWVLELYRTIIETLQSTAWLLLAFFVVAIIAYGLSRSSSKGSGAVPAAEPAPDSGRPESPPPVVAIPEHR